MSDLRINHTETMGKMKLNLYLTVPPQINSRCIKNLILKKKIEDNVGKYLHDLGDREELHKQV